MDDQCQQCAYTLSRRFLWSLECRHRREPHSRRRLVDPSSLPCPAQTTLIVVVVRVIPQLVLYRNIGLLPPAPLAFSTRAPRTGMLPFPRPSPADLTHAAARCLYLYLYLRRMYLCLCIPRSRRIVGCRVMLMPTPTQIS